MSVGYSGGGGGAGGIWAPAGTLSETNVANATIDLPSDPAARYLVEIAYRPVTNNTVLQTRFVIGGVVYASADYRWASRLDAATSSSRQGSSGSTVINLAYAVGNGDPGGLMRGYINVFDPHNTARHTRLTAFAAGGLGSDFYGHHVSSGSLLVANNVEGIQLFSSSGDIAEVYATVWAAS